MTLKEKIENLLRQPIPEPSEHYYNTGEWLGEHKAYYAGRESAFNEILKLIDL